MALQDRRQRVLRTLHARLPSRTCSAPHPGWDDGDAAWNGLQGEKWTGSDELTTWETSSSRQVWPTLAAVSNSADFSHSPHLPPAAAAKRARGNRARRGIPVAHPLRRTAEIDETAVILRVPEVTARGAVQRPILFPGNHLRAPHTKKPRAQEHVLRRGQRG